MALSLRCTCGQVDAVLETARAYTRATCYCRDCRAYARWLGMPGLLDAQGGTDIVAMNPKAVRFTSGAEYVACISLGPKGLLRWYASCCRAPLGNTPRDGRIAYVGLVAASLMPSSAAEVAFGPAGRTRINLKSAQGAVKPTPLAFLRDGLRIFAGILRGRLGGQPPSLFFNADGTPIRTPEVLTKEAREALFAGD